MSTVRIAQMVELADESAEHGERLFGLQGLSPFTVNHRYDGMPVRRDVAS